ncbi:hypothetical protein D3C76_953250 [compost metagenome]
MLDDVADLFGKQLGVDGVADAARAGHRVVQLEVPVVVPGQGAHAGLRGHIQPVKGMGQAAGPGECVPVGVAVHASACEERDDLGIGSNLQGLPHDGGDTQVEVHHHALHRQPPALFLFGRSFAWCGAEHPANRERRGRSASWPRPLGREGAMAVPMRWEGSLILDKRLIYQLDVVFY